MSSTAIPSGTSDSPHPLVTGLGRFGGRWIVAALILAALLGLGISGYLEQHHHGEIATGMRTVGQGGVAWGLYISLDIYFIGISFAGISMAAFARLFRVEALQPLTRVAQLLTLVTLPMGALCVMADLGRPFTGLMILPRLARPQSPFFGTFTLVVSGALFASLVYVYLSGRADAARLANEGPRWLRPLYRIWATGWRDTMSERRRHERVAFWLALFVLPLLLVAFSTLGFVFGIQGGRPGWYGSLQAPAFVMLAGFSGVGMLIVVAAIVRRALGLREVITEKAFRILGNFLWVLGAICLYFTAVEVLTANYAASQAESHIARSIVLGRYAPLFWISVAGLALPVLIAFMQFAFRRVSIGWLVLAGLCANVATILKRFLLVVPSQTEGLLLAYERGTYVPTWVEVRVAIGLFALASLLYLMAAKIFPLVPLPERAPPFEPPASEGRNGLRTALASLTFLFGIAASVIGLALSLRFGTLPFLDPILPYSPVLFIVGVMMIFYAAAVYETVPDRRSREPETREAAP